jgi:uncharacterized protein YegL
MGMLAVLFCLGCGKAATSAGKTAARPPSAAAPGAWSEGVAPVHAARAPAKLAAARGERTMDREPARPTETRVAEKSRVAEKVAEPMASPAAPPAREESEPVPSRHRSIQSGRLTAGSFDDHERLDDYRRYLSEVMQRDAQEKLPRLDIGQRAVIEVLDGQRRPVADARVVVRPVDPKARDRQEPSASAETLLDVTTASDGRAMFLSGMDWAGDRREFQLTVHAPGKAKPVAEVVSLDQPAWQVRLTTASDRPVRRLDLALVIDTTGSMSDELEYLKVEIDSIARSVRQMFPDVTQRYALVVYRDQGDEYVTRSFDFTSSIEEFCSTLAQQHASGGGDYPEAVHLALEHTARLSWQTDDTARVVFLVADAPPHEEFFKQTLQAVSELRRKTVRVFPVGCSGVAEQAEFIFRAAAFLTQGQYLFLTDHSGVGDPHAVPNVPDYQVERLDRLMLRMIASELAGRKLAATEVLAIEGGQSPYTRPQPILPGQQQDGPVLPMSARDSRPGQQPAGGRSAWSASWASLGGLPVPSWITHWTVLVAILAGKLAWDFHSERAASGRSDTTGSAPA